MSISQPAQVSCKDIVEHARSSSSTDPAVQALADISLGHAEESVHRLFEKEGLSIPVKISYVDLQETPNVPYIKLSDWVTYLASSGRLHNLTGVKDNGVRKSLCAEFWERWRRIQPTHPIFAAADGQKVRLEDSIPLLHHGDEGRTYKRLAIMILSTHGMTGLGSHQYRGHNLSHHSVRTDPMKMNFLGATMRTHFVWAALPHTIYKKDATALDTILELYAADFRILSEDGIETPHGRLWFWCMGIKGDLPYLAKCGHMTRTFGHGPKRAVSQKPSQGVCWICYAGREDLPQPCPFEDCRWDAAWRNTCGLDPGWANPGPLLSIPHDTTNSSTFYVQDVWHCWHLGCGKSFVASSIVVILESLEGPSVAVKLERLSADYRSFCRAKHVYAFISSINRKLLGWDKSTDNPAGHWTKGHLTTRLMVWLEAFTTENAEIQASQNKLIPVLATLARVLYIHVWSKFERFVSHTKNKLNYYERASVASSPGPDASRRQRFHEWTVQVRFVDDPIASAVSCGSGSRLSSRVCSPSLYGISFIPQSVRIAAQAAHAPPYGGDLERTSRPSSLPLGVKPPHIQRAVAGRLYRQAVTTQQTGFAQTSQPQNYPKSSFVHGHGI